MNDNEITPDPQVPVEPQFEPTPESSTQAAPVATPEPAVSHELPTQDAVPAQPQAVPVAPYQVTPEPVVTPTQPQPAKHAPSMGAVVAVAIAAALTVGSVAGVSAGFAGSWLASHATSAGSSTGTVRVIPSETDEPVVAAAAAALPSVVNIDVTGATVSAGESGLPNDHPSVPFSGNAAGVAFKAAEDGGTYILTNNHVVDQAKTIVVTDQNRKQYDAELVGTDADTDIAVIKVDADLPLIEFGDASSLQVGQLVVAIGSPYGLAESVSSGVISALGRSIPDAYGSSDTNYPLVDVIQTDAAINPGNSGGALLNRNGQLIGINSAIYSESGSNDGIGFAIPADTASEIAEQLITNGTAEHPFLGIVGRDASTVAADQNLAVDKGAYIVEISPDTGAEAAGLKAGDVIVQLDDQEIQSMDDLILQVRRHAVGDEVSVTFYRGSEKTVLKMKLGVKPADLELPSTEQTTTP